MMLLLHEDATVKQVSPHLRKHHHHPTTPAFLQLQSSKMTAGAPHKRASVLLAMKDEQNQDHEAQTPLL